jgi:hypothetical protein
MIDDPKNNDEVRELLARYVDDACDMLMKLMNPKRSARSSRDMTMMFGNVDDIRAILASCLMNPKKIVMKFTNNSRVA